MPRPKNKSDLLSQGQNKYQELITYVEDLPPEMQNAEFPQMYMNRNIRDVLAHLHHWHTMMLDWYEVGMQGEKPQMPAPGYTWKTLPMLNREIQGLYQGFSLDEVKELLNNSFLQVLAKIESHTSEELFEKKRYHWTGSTSLGAYFISASSSHYQWALSLIRKSIKKIKSLQKA